jgi:diguanylate cyclase (GGDEF)-like protein/PAS domain S-box-containing protein
MSRSAPGVDTPRGRVPSVWDSRPLRLSGVLAVVATVWFTAMVAEGPVGPVIVDWLLLPVCSGLCAALAWQTGRDPEVAPAARRFWRQTGFALAVLSVSLAAHMADSTNADLTMSSRLSMHAAALQAVAVLLLLWPLFRLPTGATTRGRKLALSLDVSILVAAAAIFFWHFVGGPATDGNGNQLIASVGFMTAALVGVLAVAKVALIGSETLDPTALRALGGALAVGGVGAAMPVLLVTRPYLDVSQFIVPVACFAFGLGARRQSIGGVTRNRAPARRRYSMLPYLAAAATDVLLLAAVIQQSADLLLVAAAAVAVTALVILRQLTAFQEIDAGLLELGNKEQRFRLLVQNSTDVVTITEPDGTIRYISPAVRRVLGSEPAPMVGTDLALRVHPDDRAAMAGKVAYVAGRPGATATYQMRLAHADGSWRWLDVISANLLDEPSVAGIVSNSRDVTETREVQERLSYEATHDVLTGLANRALFSERVEAAVADPAHRVSIVLVDLDDFKTVNDTLGHAVGDGLLVTVADRMRAGVRRSDTVARLGGDEFAILFEGLGGADVDGMLTRIADALLEPVQIDGHPLTVRASFGVVDRHGGDDAGNLLRQADIAMYEAKARGEGGCQRYRPGMEARGAQRSRLAARLREALDGHELVLHYQPVVALSDGRISGAEALVRWQHPSRGLLPPGAFIPVAEETGLVAELGRWVLREACRQAAEWLAEYGDRAPGTVSVNVSARQLREAGFAAEVAEALRDSGLPPHRLTVEITESTAVGGGATQKTLQGLRAMGVRLSLDDFGTGASTLSLLAGCPVDQIKLDRSFVPVPGPDAIATAVLQLATAFGAEAVAEGVETREQAERLRRIGYERAQGHHFACALPAAELTARLAACLTRAAASTSARS